jgi:hypothetical protein
MYAFAGVEKIAHRACPLCDLVLCITHVHAHLNLSIQKWINWMISQASTLNTLEPIQLLYLIAQFRILSLLIKILVITVCIIYVLMYGCVCIYECVCMNDACTYACWQN